MNKIHFLNILVSIIHLLAWEHPVSLVLSGPENSVGNATLGVVTRLALRPGDSVRVCRFQFHSVPPGTMQAIVYIEDNPNGVPRGWWLRQPLREASVCYGKQGSQALHTAVQSLSEAIAIKQIYFSKLIIFIYGKYNSIYIYLTNWSFSRTHLNIVYCAVFKYFVSK